MEMVEESFAEDPVGFHVDNLSLAEVIDPTTPVFIHVDSQKEYNHQIR